MEKEKSDKELRGPPLNPAKYYIVGFFDLVGIGQELAELGRCAKIGQKEIDHLGKQALKVIHFRDDFEKFEEGERRVLGQSEKSRSDEEREWREHNQGNPVKTFMFTDAVIAFSSLDVVEKRVPLESCSNILMKAAASQLFTLARKAPVRGGIEIGLGIEIADREVFGVGFYEAYQLERNIADWPRIVVGKRLQKYIVDVSEGNCACDSEHLNQEHARLCLDLLCFDDDNVAMIDLLSPAIAAIVGNDYLEYLAKTKAFVEAELEYFTKQGDSRLAERYTKLFAYLHNNRE